MFSKPVKLEEAYNKLNDYLNNNRPQRGQNIYIDSYHDILQEINLIISGIYNNNTLLVVGEMLVYQFYCCHDIQVIIK